MRTEVIGDATLYCADCIEVLPTLGRVNAVVTDPPYGIGLDYGACKDTPEEIDALAKKWVPLARGISDRLLLTPGVPNIWRYPPADWVLNWTDPSGEGGCPWGFPSWQPILAYGKDPFLQAGLGRRSDTTVKRYLRERNIGHPCPKPVGVMAWIVERGSFFGHTILDPFMGSGTTGVAALQLGRKFIGIELDPGYFDIACKRIEQAWKQPRLFEEPKRKPEPAPNLFDGAQP